MSSRERFEAWWGGAPTHIDPVNAIAWQAWQAARAEALEEAAEVVERNALLAGSYGPLMDVGWALANKTSAKAIRALKDKEPA